MKKLLVTCLSMLLVATSAFAEEYPKTSWDDLIPEGWEPPIPVQDHSGKFAPKQETAPVVEALNGKKIKIPGYVLPLKFKGEEVLEFLLVPFVGACIHVPPPPENQMVVVKLKTPMNGRDLWDPVWVSGVMQTKRLKTEFATAGYFMENALAEDFKFEYDEE